MWYMPTQAKEVTPRQRLLDAVVAFALEHGVADVSLRQLAAAVGTSHRMLIHHFGSRENLLVEVIRVVESQQRALFAGDLDTSGTPTDAARRQWKRLSAPALARQERLFFEVYGQALRGQPWATPMLEGVVSEWVESLADRHAAAGVPARDAPAAARLGVAVTRGLLLDLLATGDRRGVDQAMNLFLEMSARQTAPHGR
jgi:AcrR family transcriptional regulator